MEDAVEDVSQKPKENLPISVNKLKHFSTAQLLDELKLRHGHMIGKRDKRIIFLGPPGSGKGTQSEAMTKLFALKYLSTGNMLREAAAQKNEFGTHINEILRAGKFVGDDIVFNLVERNLNDASLGFLLDGFPRNVNQARKLDELLKRANLEIDVVIFFEIHSDLLERRICGRWIHEPSNRVYHVDFNPPITPGLDNLTGEPLIQRKDDTPEVFRKRLFIYEEETAPLLNYYKRILYKVDAAQSLGKVSEVIAGILGNFNYIST